MVTITRPDGSTFEQSPEDVARDKAEIEAKNIRDCEARGGRWDATNKRCILPDKDKPVPDPKQPIPPETRTRIERDEFGNIISTTLEPLRPITKEERLGVGLAGLGGQVGAKEALAQRQAEGVIEAEIQAQLLEEPVRRELDPRVNPLEIIPVIGPPLNNLQRAIKDKLPFLAKGDDPSFTEITPEELRTEALTEIERREIERGLTDSEKFGRFAEALPASELAKWIPGLAGAEKPSGNVQTIVKSLKQLKTRGRDIISNAETGDLSRSQAEERILVIELELQEGESRIRLLLQESPEMKFNSDGVNFIEGKILEVRIILQDAKIAAIRGEVSESQMTDRKILESLEEDFTIPGL